MEDHSTLRDWFLTSAILYCFFFLYLRKERKCWPCLLLPFSSAYSNVWKDGQQWQQIQAEGKVKLNKGGCIFQEKWQTLVPFMSGSSCFLSWKPENLLSTKGWFKYVCHLCLKLVCHGNLRHSETDHWSSCALYFIRLVTFSCACMKIFSVKHLTFLSFAFFPCVSWWFFSNNSSYYKELLRPFITFAHKLYVSSLQLDMAG